MARDADRPEWGLRKRRLRPEEYRKRSSYVRFEWSWVLMHPRVAELSDGQLRAWFALVASVVGRDEPEGRSVLGELRRFLTPRGSRAVKQADLDAFLDVGLIEAIDGEPGAYRVRKWSAWSPLDATRVYRDRAYRERLTLRGAA